MKSEVEIADAAIDHRLREKGQDEFERQPDEHPEQHLHEQPLVRAQIAEEEATARACGGSSSSRPGSGALVKCGRRFDQQIDARRSSPRAAYPAERSRG